MDDDLRVHERPSYQSSAHKLATFFIMTAGSAKATQFPIMFIVYGGVPFLVAYLTLLATIAMPIMHLESNLGQFAGDGNRGIFSTVPLFIGLGYTMTMYAVLHSIGDSVTLSENLIQFLKSLKATPWVGCDQQWVSDNRTCYTIRPGMPLCRTLRLSLAESFRSRSYQYGLPLIHGEEVVLVPAFTYNEEGSNCVPGLYSSLQSYYLYRHGSWANTSFSHVESHPLLSVAAIWMFVFAMAHNGFTHVRRFFYVMTYLYALTTTLLFFRGITLSGGIGGLAMFFYADWSSVVDHEMWFNALYISLESVGVTGSLFLGIVRFNRFKDKYQEDVKFVLVADTASKGLGTAITFMFLGHLSSSVGIDVTMLVRMDSKLFVSITPQAVSIVSNSQFWTQIHSVWLISTILPKFVLVPDILLEVLSASHPPVVEHRTMAHFCVCTLLVVVSVVACTPGGMAVASLVFHQHDRIIRFLIFTAESFVILQYYGMRRLIIDCKMMTNECPNMFLRLCWTSIIPSIIIDEHQALVPLPSWTPDDWEQSMAYRQALVAEGMDVSQREERLSSMPPATCIVPEPTRQSTVSETAQTTSDQLGTNLIVFTTQASPGTSGWRHDSEDSTPPPSTKERKDVAAESGTLHKSRSLSSVLRSVRRKAALKGTVQLDNVGPPPAFLPQRQQDAVPSPGFLPQLQQDAIPPPGVLPQRLGDAGPPPQLLPKKSSLKSKALAKDGSAAKAQPKVVQTQLPPIMTPDVAGIERFSAVSPGSLVPSQPPPRPPVEARRAPQAPAAPLLPPRPTAPRQRKVSRKPSSVSKESSVKHMIRRLLRMPSSQPSLIEPVHTYDSHKHQTAQVAGASNVPSVSQQDHRTAAATSAEPTKAIAEEKQRPDVVSPEKTPVSVEEQAPPPPVVEVPNDNPPQEQKKKRKKHKKKKREEKQTCKGAANKDTAAGKDANSL
ncbi:sodium-dependent dopamine transporter-like isoform X2 [Ornithodoros turicata]|uniref:sodium-dependent dopamine transporter-like isoform X2 n=1 Tax=Ornithodoros turicata TaxID=34597 RepID=UPI003138D4C1